MALPDKNMGGFPKPPVNDITTTRVLDAAITQAKLAPRTAGSSVAAGGVAVSGTGGSAVTSTSFTDYPSLSVTIVTTGRPVMVFLQQNGDTGSTNDGEISAGSSFGRLAIVRDSTQIVAYGLTQSTSYPPSCFQAIDAPAAGSHTYKIQVKSAAGSVTAQFTVLVAYEI